MKKSRFLVVLLLVVTVLVFASCSSNVNIEFDSDGGSAIETISLKAGESIDEAPVPEKTGYNFGGWFDLEADEMAEFPYTASVSTTLLALWEPVVYNITFVTNNSKPYADKTYTIETALALGTPPAETGYKFSGWFANQTSGSAQSVISKGSTGDKTFYARWEPLQYSIVYNLSGGSYEGIDYPEFYTIDEEVALISPKKDNNSFTGWYDNENLEGSYIERIPEGSTGEKNFYAEWETTEYSVTYHTGGGQISGIYPQGYNVGKTVSLPTPTRIGYFFGGWFDNYGFSGSPVSEILANDSGAKEYWALWDDTTYSITYHLNGGSGAELGEYGVDDEVILPVPTRAGYEFSGWYDNSEFDGASVSIIPKGTIGNKEFYAKWAEEIAEKTFTFEAENVDLTGKVGAGHSNSAREGKMIQEAVWASGGRVVGFMHDRVTLDFVIISDRAVTGADLKLFVGVDMGGTIEYSKTHISISVNSAEPSDFTPIEATASEGRAIEINNIDLSLGENTIRISVDGRTVSPFAPIIDCLQITVGAELRWTPFIN